MSVDSNNRTVMITGAAGGIGQALTAAFATTGMRVLATDIDGNGLDALMRELESRALAEHVVPQVLDVADYSACEAAVANAPGSRVDILVNNAAMGMSAISPLHMTELVTIEQIDPALWERFVAVNFSGAWYLTRAVVPGMKAREWGRIINVTTSMFTMLRERFHPYGPAKAGMEAMSAGHALEFAPFGITVNVVVPGGPADTPMVPPESGFDRADLIPPAKMAAPMLWLASEEAGGTTGNRYIAADWDDTRPLREARAAAEAPIAWPGLAGSPVWPGGSPGG